VATAVNAHGGPHGRLDFESETFVCFDPNQITSKDNRSNPRPGDPSPPLATFGSVPMLAQQQLYSIMPQNSSRDYKARPVDVAQPIMAGGPVGGNQGGDVIVTHSLRADGFDASEDGTGRGTPLVPVAFPANISGTQRLSSEDLSPSMGAKNPTAVAMPIKKAHGSGGNGAKRNSISGEDGDPMFSLDQSSQHAVMVASFQQSSMTGVGTVGYDPDTKVLRPVKPQHDHQMLQLGSAVRRLTPRECCRLQGFPDDYLDIQYRGKPAADGNKYKALGNSMAVPVMRWIGEQIARVNASEAD